jgi:hypothetical protein
MRGRLTPPSSGRPPASCAGLRPPLVSNVRQHQRRFLPSWPSFRDLQCTKAHATVALFSLFCRPRQRLQLPATAHCAVASVARGSTSSSAPSRSQGIRSQRPSTSGVTRHCEPFVARPAVASRTGSHCSPHPMEGTGLTSPTSIPNLSPRFEFVGSMARILGSSSTHSARQPSQGETVEEVCPSFATQRRSTLKNFRCVPLPAGGPWSPRSPYRSLLKLSRVSGAEAVKALVRLGFTLARQKGSHGVFAARVRRLCGPSACRVEGGHFGERATSSPGHSRRVPGRLVSVSPDLSIERTLQRLLRALWPAAHAER